VRNSETRPWYEPITDRTTTRLYDSGAAIALQGEEANKIGYVLSGRAKAVAFSENGEATWVGYFKTGDFFGHMALLSKSPPPFEIIAETDVKVILVTSAIMQQLLAEQEALSLEIAKDLAARLDQMTHRLIEAFTLSETVSRTVSNLQKKGILVREPGAIIIQKPERLRENIK